MPIKGSTSHFMFMKQGVCINEENLLSQLRGWVRHLLNQCLHSRAWHSSRHRRGTWCKCCVGRSRERQVKKEEVLYVMFQKNILQNPCFSDKCKWCQHLGASSQVPGVSVSVVKPVRMCAGSSSVAMHTGVGSGRGGYHLFGEAELINRQ